MKLLIIRPEPGASASAARAKAAGFEPVVLPFFEVRPRAWSAPDPADFDALLVSSANAIRHAGPALESLKSLPARAVGEHSAKAARDAGLNLASTGETNVDALVAAAAAMGHRRLLWLAGEERSDIRPRDNVMIEAMTVYASDPANLPPDAPAIIASCPLVALHSARAAKAFAEFADSHALPRADFILAAFSPAIAQAAGMGWKGIAVAPAPTDQALLSAASALVTEIGGMGQKGDED